MANTKSQADAAAALDSLGAVTTNGELDDVLLVSYGVGESPELARLNPSEPLARRFTEIASDKSQDLREKALRAYSAGALVASGEVMWVDASTVPLLINLSVALGNRLDLPLFNPRNTRRVRLSIVAISTPNDGLMTFHRILRPTFRLSRSRFFGALFRGAAYDQLTEEVLLFDDRIDVVVAHGMAFFENRASFERVFGFLEQMQAQARDTFARVTQGLEIEGLAELEKAATTEVNMMAKMESIKRKLDSHPAYEQAMVMPKLIDFLATHPEADVEIQHVGGLPKLVFHNDPQRRWKILKLLDDDYLASSLTALKYEANSKSDPLP